jgi:hypothetical protein
VKQLFEIDWSEGRVTAFLLSSLLRDYLKKIGTPGAVTVTEREHFNDPFNTFNSIGSIRPETILANYIVCTCDVAPCTCESVEATRKRRLECYKQ